MKGYFKNMKTITKVDFATYLGVILAFIVVSVCQAQGLVNRSLGGMLVPICCYVCMSISLNLTVGILGELSLGHAGFMSVGAFSGIIAAMSLQSAVPNDLVRMIVALVVGAFFAAIVGFIVGIPVLRLRGDYLAIVTLAFGEIIKDLINCLLVGWDENGLHIALNVDGTKSMSSLGLSENGIEIIKGAQGATGNARIATFAMGFALVMITLVVVLNLVRSRTGRAIMAIRDNRIAAESVGINVTKYKLIAFVTSASLAGAAGALFGLNYSNVTAVQFDFNTSILVLVYVVLGGLGNIWGSIVATVVLYVLPEALRQFSDYRMLVYAIVLILVMLATNNPQVRTLISRPHRPQRRRQNHHLQPADQGLSAHPGHHPAGWTGYLRQDHSSDQPHGHCPDLPEHPPVQQPLRGGQCEDRSPQSGALLRHHRRSAPALVLEPGKGRS